jgi:hypothetical protein
MRFTRAILVIVINSWLCDPKSIVQNTVTIVTLNTIYSLIHFVPMLVAMVIHRDLQLVADLVLPQLLGFYE